MRVRNGVLNLPMKTKLSAAFIAALEAARFELVARYVSLGWELLEARSAAERTYTVSFFRSLHRSL